MIIASVYSLTLARCSIYRDELFNDLSLFPFQGNFNAVGGLCPFKGPVLVTFVSVPFIYLDLVQATPGSSSNKMNSSQESLVSL